MNKRTTLISIMSAMIVFTMIGCVAKPPQTLTLNQMHDDFDYMIKVIDEVYPAETVNRQIYGIDIKNTLARYRARITGDETPQEFYQLVFDALYACKGNHLWATSILAQVRTQLFFWTWFPKEIHTIGIGNDEIDIAWAYARNSNMGIRSTPGIPLLHHKGEYYSKYPFSINGRSYPSGLKLIAINGRKIQNIVQDLQDRLDCFDNTKKQFYGSMFHKRVGDDFYMLLGNIDLNFEFEDKAGDPQEMRVRSGELVVWDRPDIPLVASTPAVEVMKENGFLYIRLPAMDNAGRDFIINRLAKLKDTGSIRAVLLDVRFNQGGSDWSWMSILARIFRNNIPLKSNFAYRDGEIVRQYMAKMNRFDLASGKIVFLEDQEFLVSFSHGTIRPTSDSLNLQVPLFILTQDVYSSTGSLLSLAHANPFITRVGTINPASLGKGSDPWFFALPNSKIIFSMSPNLDISNCSSPEDTLHCDVDIEVDPGLPAMLEYYNASRGGESLESAMRKHDPFFIAICEYMRKKSLPDDKTKK